MTPIPTPDNEDACGICSIIITENDRAIKCDKCDKWIHTKCNKITNKQYKLYQENHDEIFECKNCNKCSVCEKIVAKNHHAIECDLCLKWIHIKCNKFDIKEYKNYQTDKTMKFYCMKCLRETLPALNLNDIEFNLTMEGIDYPEETNINDIFLNETQIEIVNTINKVINNGFDCHNDITENESEVPSIDCKYYTTNEFIAQKFDPIKNVSILHLNIHSVEFHIEEFRIVLQLLQFKFDFICLTESKVRKGHEPKTDISIDGYKYPVGMPTEATKVGF